MKVLVSKEIWKFIYVMFIAWVAITACFENETTEPLLSHKLYLLLYFRWTVCGIWCLASLPFLNGKLKAGLRQGDEQWIFPRAGISHSRNDIKSDTSYQAGVYLKAACREGRKSRQVKVYEICHLDSSNRISWAITWCAMALNAARLVEIVTWAWLPWLAQFFLIGVVKVFKK